MYNVYKHEPILKDEYFLPCNIQRYANAKQQSNMT